MWLALTYVHHASIAGARWWRGSCARFRRLCVVTRCDGGLVGDRGPCSDHENGGGRYGDDRHRASDAESCGVGEVADGEWDDERRSPVADKRVLNPEPTGPGARAAASESCGERIDVPRPEIAKPTSAIHREGNSVASASPTPLVAAPSWVSRTRPTRTRTASPANRPIVIPAVNVMKAATAVPALAWRSSVSLNVAQSPEVISSVTAMAFVCPSTTAAEASYRR